MKPEEYISQQVHYKTFSGKAQMEYTSGDNSQQFSANIRMNKGKDVWASVIALGGLLEAARAYITPQELKAINKLERKYYRLAYTEGLALLQAEVSFDDLQNLIIGNPLMTGSKIEKSEETETQMTIYVSQDDLHEALVYDKKTGTLRQIDLSAPARGFSCRIQYNGYAPTTGKQPFAFKRAINITNKGKNIKLDMNFTKADLDMPVEMPFTIPSGYEKANIQK